MKKIYPAVLALICLILCGCARESREYAKSLFAMDTIMDLKIYSDSDKALIETEEEINRADALLDRQNEGGDIYNVNTQGSAVISDETAYIIKTALEVSEMTDGAFDITTAPLSDLWGFYGGNFRVPSDTEISRELEYTGYKNVRLEGNTISLPKGFSIDLGAIAKGYLSDRAVQILKENNVGSAVISLGGNVYAVGSKPDGKPWKIGIKNPIDKSELAGTVSVCDKAVVTSGGYERYFERDGKVYHHIIDPSTGKSAHSGLSSVTVISDSGIKADALSTALFVTGLESGLELYRKSRDFEAIFIDDNGKIYTTGGISDSFESEREFSVCG